MLLAPHRQAILEVAARHGAHNVRVFGSVAGGRDGPGSDVDLLVDLEEGRTLLDLGGLVMDLTDLIGRPVDVVTVGGLRGAAREDILREARPL